MKEIPLLWYYLFGHSCSVPRLIMLIVINESYDQVILTTGITCGKPIRALLVDVRVRERLQKEL